jgi:hypothetical protein
VENAMQKCKKGGNPLRMEKQNPSISWFYPFLPAICVVKSKNNYTDCI